MFNYGYFIRGSQGVSVDLGDQRVKSLMTTEGFYAPVGTETLVAVKPTIINTTQSAVDDFIPEERSCYTNDEFNPVSLRKSYGYMYHIQNCLYDSVIQIITQVCRCQPTFASKAKLPVCRGELLGYVQNNF